MNDLDILALRAFIFTLHQLPAISPELQTALQNLPSDIQGIIAGVEDLTDQEPLATTYIQNYALLQSREGHRSKSKDEMSLPDDEEPTDELGNTLFALEGKSAKELEKKSAEIFQSSDPKRSIFDWLGIGGIGA